jgi:predicted metal-dependent phosphoesterase TrpH
MSRIDLHTHSTASDGTLTPAELVGAAAAAGLAGLALTDHDTTAGWAEAAAALPPGLTLVPGVELSCVAQEPDRAVSLHLLGYLIDPAEPRLRAHRRRLRGAREGRARRMVELLRADGHPVSWERVRALAAGPVGRPHLARALVDAGRVASLEEAFGPEWIGTGGRYWAPRPELDVVEAIGLVRAAGGVAVFAHPYARRRGVTVRPATIARMAAAGLAGLEVDHPDHEPGERAELRALADELDLVPTGASDFHGAARPQPLGVETTGVEAYERLVAAAAHPPVTA